MKKLYLSIILLGIFILMFVVTMIPTQAYTFNGSYDFSNVDLDESLTELNGATLNNLFDYDYLYTIPLIELNGLRNKFELDGNEVVFNEYYYYDETYLNLIDYENHLSSGVQYYNEYIYNGSWFTKILEIPLEIGKSYKLSFNWQFNGNVPGSTAAYLQYSSVNGVVNPIWSTLTTNSNPGWTTTTTFTATQEVIYFQVGHQGNGTSLFNDFILYDSDYIVQEFVDFDILTDSIRINSTPVVNIDLTQSLLVNNLENMSVDLLNYYFAVFLLNKFNLPVGDLWNYAYTAGTQQGYEDGYEDGEDFGYIDGYDDGLVEGYFNGETQGLIDGYNTGYNEGVDYAVQANISILSIFELIFGVALNMLTFIITIDIFGISILSLISVLSLFVGVVWILKMIRG